MGNKTMILGNLCADPISRETKEGKKVANLVIAVNEKYKDKNGEKVEKTDFFNVVAWGNQVKFIEDYLGKGDMVHVEGKIRTESYEKDNVTHYTFSLVVNEIRLLVSRNKKVEKQNSND